MSRLKTVGATLGGTGVCVAALVGYLAMLEEGRPGARITQERGESPADQAPPSVETNPPPTERTPGFVDLTLDDVALACPGFFVAADHCVAALDRHYLDMSPSSVLDGLLKPIVISNRAMTLRRVFEDPEAKRRAIEDAWNDPVCAETWPPVGAPEGWSGGIRADLRKRCQADAMAEFSVLVELCAVHSGYGRNEYANRASAIDRFDAIEDTQTYWEERAAFEDEHYLKLWLEEKCKRTKPGTLAALHEYVHTGDWFTDFLTYLGDVSSLQRRAAWLGQEWAMAQYKDSHGPLAATYADALREADPLRYHVHEAYRLRGEQAALTHVLAASRLAARQEAEIDSEELFQLAGAYGLDELEEANRAALKILGQTDDERDA